MRQVWTARSHMTAQVGFCPALATLHHAAGMFVVAYFSAGMSSANSYHGASRHPDYPQRQRAPPTIIAPGNFSVTDILRLVALSLSA